MKGFSGAIIIAAIGVVVIGTLGYFLIEKDSGEEPISAVPPYELPVPPPALSTGSGQAPLPPKPIFSPASGKNLPPPAGRSSLPPTAKPPAAKPPEVKHFERPRDPWRDPIIPAPTNLALPFNPKDLRLTEELISPYGIIRHSRDSGIGHGGIDVPLKYGDPVYAVYDGVIFKEESGGEGGAGVVDILILPGGFAGEGWIFKYESIALDPGLAIGNSVKRGQKIGTSAIKKYGNNHVGLEYHFKNFTIARDKTCWVDLLESAAKAQLESEFNELRQTQNFMQSWQTANEEGFYQYRGLLDKAKYPDGPRLCYPMGTDARIPMN